MLKDRIKEFVSHHREEIVRDLLELVKIPSVSTDKAACEEMLCHTRALYEAHGFKTEKREKYLLAYYGEGKKQIGLFAHGDVVEGGKGWTLTSPFEPEIHNGFIVGRGAWDDKSAVVISLYTMLAMKELQIPMSSQLMCYTGACEENGMDDIISYVRENIAPTFSFVLDAGFPVYYGDKGKSWVRAHSRHTLSDIKDIGGGKMINIVLGNASARLRYSEALFGELREKEGITLEKSGDEIIVSAKGNSTHAAAPRDSVNGAWIIANVLKDVSALDEGDRRLMASVAHVLKSPFGDTVGIENDDSEFGCLTMANGIMGVEDGILSFTLDLRYGKAVKTDKMLSTLENALDKLGFDLEIISKDDAYAIDKDNEYLKSYLRAYSEYTGEENPPMHINAGSTYAKRIGNACEVGMTHRGGWLDLPKGHGHAHEPNECISIDGLCNALEIIIYAISEALK